MPPDAPLTPGTQLVADKNTRTVIQTVTHTPMSAWEEMCLSDTWFSPAKNRMATTPTPNTSGLAITPYLYETTRDCISWTTHTLCWHTAHSKVSERQGIRGCFWDLVFTFAPLQKILIYQIVNPRYSCIYMVLLNISYTSIKLYFKLH